MLPKEFYEGKKIHPENNYVFALFPSELEDQYLKHIKTPIENITTKQGKVMCESYLDFVSGTQVMQGIWKGIGRANVVIADLTFYKPNVMYELGVTLMNKENVYIMANKNLGLKSIQDLPYDLSHTTIKFYDDDTLEEMTQGIVDFIASKIDILYDEELIKDAEVAILMEDAKDIIRSNKSSAALHLFSKMNEKEPENWYIHQEWGNTFVKNKNIEEAYDKFLKAIEYAKSNRHKALVHIDIALMHISNKQENNALIYFSKAESLDRSNAILYEKWSYLYYLMGDFQEASKKMLLAVKLKSIKEYRLKAQYYHQRLIDPDFRMKLGPWLKQNELEGLPKTKYDYIPKRNLEKKSDNKNKDIVHKRNSFVAFRNNYVAESVIIGEITNIVEYGIFVKFLENNASGLIHKSALPKSFDMLSRYQRGKQIEVKVKDFDNQKYKIELVPVK